MSAPSRILLVVDSLAPGGAETSLAELVGQITKSGVEVHLAYLGVRDDLKDHFLSAGARLWPLHGHHSRWGRALAVRDLCRTLSPDLVHTTLFEADIAGRLGARLARIPVASSIVNEMYGPEQRREGLRRSRVLAAQALDIATARTVVRFHAITHTVADVMQPRLHIRKDLIDVVPRGRDPERLMTWSPHRRTLARRSLGIEENTPVVLAVARIEPQKGLDTLLRAVPRLRAAVPGVKVLVAGRSGSDSGRLERIMNDLALDDTVTMLGARDDVPELLVGADVLAFPSRWEGLGGTLLEAMALECPIVCSDLPVLREVVGPATSTRFFAVGDSDSLAAQMTDALSSDRDTRSLGAARQHFLDNFTINACADRMLAFYAAATEPGR